MSPDGGVGKIRVLPVEVVGRIAAGEVIERPAAVVKELLDNSLDAGSSTITVEVRDGGLGLIRVTDDGEGMSRADAPLAFQRHATSKLRSDQDLWSVRTLGFRGEALPSIAAVSKVRLLTSSRDEPVGTQVSVVGGSVIKIEDAAAVRGTRVEVTDLFYNTPARKKFLKSPTTEFAHITQTVQQAGLAWPSVHFRLFHNGRVVLNLPAVSSVRDRVLQIYRLSFLDRAVEVSGQWPGLKIGGFAIQPIHARASRTPQDLFVNRRPVRNATVFHAIADGYASFLAKGRYPVFVLFLDVDASRVDVNVHPTKREIRFVDQETVHHAVRQAVREALGATPRFVPVGDVQFAGWDRSGPRESTAAGSDQSMLRQPDVWSGPRSEVAVATPRTAIRDVSDGETLQTSFVHESGQPYGVAGLEVLPLGQINRTFLVAQVGSELQVVDQHTAHERVLFERLWRAWQRRAVQSQPLLLPEPIDVPPDKAILLERRLGDFEQLGLAIEPFGTGTFIVRAVPALLGRLDAASLIQDLIDELTQWESLSSLEAKMRPIIATLACHGAVRAGRVMNLPEVKQLIEDWVKEGLIMTCPHGRRVALRLPAEELAKIFGRT